MINSNRVLAIIPARGGSKGLPNKNKIMICGKPLIAWTIEKSMISKYIDDTLVTSDDQEILEISAELGVKYLVERPDYLSTDVATTSDVVEHAISYMVTTFKKHYDLIVLLEPTSPLRENEDIDLMLEKLSQNQHYDGIVSLGKIGLENPLIAKKISSGKVEPLFEVSSKISRRQDSPDSFFPYGVAYIIKTNIFLTTKSFYTDNLTYYIINRYQNYEIDDYYDFLCVESIMKHQWNIL